MSYRTLLLAAAALTFASATQAADLIVDEAALPGVVEASNPSLYVQVLGGLASGDVTFYDLVNSGDALDYDMDLGYAFAGTVGVVFVDHLAVELDVLHTSRTYSDYPDDTQDTTSLMVNAKADLALTDMFGLYAAIGAGVIHSNNVQVSGLEFGYTGFGYQLIGGVSAAVADNVALIGEVRLQNSFDALDADDSADEYTVDGGPLVTAMAGLKFSF